LELEPQTAFLEFFAAGLINPNTRLAYYHAADGFLAWCDRKGLALKEIKPIHVAAYFAQYPGSPRTKQQHLAAIRMLFSWFVERGALEINPARDVRSPKFSRVEGKTPAFETEEVQKILNTIDVSDLIGLRDKALIASLAYTFARITAVPFQRPGRRMETLPWCWRFLLMIVLARQRRQGKSRFVRAREARRPFPFNSRASSVFKTRPASDHLLEFPHRPPAIRPSRDTNNTMIILVGPSGRIGCQ
jgi:integrase